MYHGNNVKLEIISPLYLCSRQDTESHSIKNKLISSLTNHLSRGSSFEWKASKIMSVFTSRTMYCNMYKKILEITQVNYGINIFFFFK